MLYDFFAFHCVMVLVPHRVLACKREDEKLQSGLLIIVFLLNVWILLNKYLSLQRCLRKK